MNDGGPIRPGAGSTKIVKVVVGVALFCVLMWLRAESAQLWVRVALAALAGAVLGWTLLGVFRKQG